MVDEKPLFRRRVPVVFQDQTSECGLACLAMIAGYHGLKLQVLELGALAGSYRGTTLKRLIEVADALRLQSRALRLDIEGLRELRVPAILHWGMNHYVVLEKITRDGAVVVDPASGRRRVSREVLDRRFTGVALELSLGAKFERGDHRNALQLKDLVAGYTGLIPAICWLIGLSLAIQLLALLLPVFSQLVLDDVIGNGDRGLLLRLGWSFSLIAVLMAVIMMLRTLTVARLSGVIQYDWAAALFGHLIRLPLEFFERRHMGDLVSRFGSLAAIQRILATTSLEALVDGLMSITALVVILFYSLPLGMVVAAGIMLYMGAKVALYGPYRQRVADSVVLAAKENSIFMDSVRAIQTLKAYAKEHGRSLIWRNAKAEAVSAELARAQHEGLQNVMSLGVQAILTVVVIWLGAGEIIAGRLSIGQLVAFLGFQTLLLNRAVALIDKIIETRLIKLHLERLTDIVKQKPEVRMGAMPGSIPHLRGRIEARNLWFRFSKDDPWIIRSFDLIIEAGQCVCLSGPSGLGKSTLLKLLMGLMRPMKGDVLVDGKSLSSYHPEAFRRQIGSVMQDDRLLTGTIAENISLFEPEPDQDRIESCARMAAIDEDINRMPLGYMTSVGDMGSTLSGGQQQRIFLARALYATPRILYLDEATSQLDGETERQINEEIRRLNITRVMAAHRQETANLADRIIRLDRES